MKSFLKQLVPNYIKHKLKFAYKSVLDIVDRFKHRRGMVPPKSKIFVGTSDFKKTGEEFKGHFIKLAKLQPNHRVLDVGSGIGRMAIPLTDYLQCDGTGDGVSYCGFDIVQEGVEWCQERITSKFSNFQFQHSDVFNKHYNPEGRHFARDYRFPHNADYFDFCFLTSVFTHMLPSDLDNYVGEVSRVLRVGGKCLITFFVLNDESNLHIARGNSTLDFRHELQDCMTTNTTDPESAIAYDEGYIFELFEKHGLEIEHPIYFGSWCGREEHLSYQDIIIARKKCPDD